MVRETEPSCDSKRKSYGAKKIETIQYWYGEAIVASFSLPHLQLSMTATRSKAGRYLAMKPSTYPNKDSGSVSWRDP